MRISLSAEDRHAVLRILCLSGRFGRVEVVKHHAGRRHIEEPAVVVARLLQFGHSLLHYRAHTGLIGVDAAVLKAALAPPILLHDAAAQIDILPHLGGEPALLAIPLRQRGIVRVVRGDEIARLFGKRYPLWRSKTGGPLGQTQPEFG